MAQDVKLLAFHLTKTLAQRNEDFDGELKITPNMNLSSIEKEKIEAIKQDVLKIKFNFSIDYGDLGKVEADGTMMLQVDSKTLKETLSSWKKKSIDPQFQLMVLNIIMQKASLKALQLEEEIGLPPHIQLPRLQLGEKPKE